MRLGELVATRLAGLDAAALGVLELVAVGAPLELGLLDGDEPAALEALELRGLVERLDDRRRRHVDVAHPLHGEAIRARLGRSRLDAIQRRLADAIERGGARRRGDVLRIAAWRLECGGERDGGLFVRAAAQALAALDWPLAERLASAALQAGGGFDARLSLARALAGSGRAAEAEALLRELQDEAGDDLQRLMVAITRASNLFWGLDRTDDADAALADAERAIGVRALRDELVALRGFLVVTLGRPLDALIAAAPLLESEQAREQTRLRAALTVGTALMMRGRSDKALAVIDEWLPVAQRHRDELAMLEGQLLGTRPLVLQVAGRLLEADEAARRAYDFELAARSPAGMAFAAFGRGSVALGRGRVQTALRWYRESAALARESDAIGFLPWVLVGIAQAASEAGEVELARRTMAEVEATPAQGTRNFAVALELARAWRAAADGELSRARATALAAADLAESLGQDGFAVRALHDVTRFGDPAAATGRLDRLAEHVDGSFVRDAAAQAARAAAPRRRGAAGDRRALRRGGRAAAGGRGRRRRGDRLPRRRARGQRARRGAPQRRAAEGLRGRAAADAVRRAHRRRAHLARARGRAARGDRPQQPRDRRAPGGLDPHGRQPPAPRLPQARHHPPRGAHAAHGALV